jgi:hypothetical protein
MIDTGNSKKMVEKEGPASEREAGPFFFQSRGEEPSKLVILAVDGSFQGLFLIDFFCYYVTIKKIILLQLSLD